MSEKNKVTYLQVSFCQRMVQSSWREATKPKIRAQLACSTITVKVAVNYLQIKE